MNFIGRVFFGFKNDLGLGIKLKYKLGVFQLDTEGNVKVIVIVGTLVLLSVLHFLSISLKI